MFDWVFLEEIVSHVFEGERGAFHTSELYNLFYNVNPPLNQTLGLGCSKGG